MDDFKEDHVLKLITRMSVKDCEIQPEVQEQVKERGHILFTTLTLFYRVFGRYMVNKGKIGETIIETTASPIMKVINSDNP